MLDRISMRPPGQGLYEFTRELHERVEAAGVRDGLCTLFVQHTSASLLISENADPSARADLERWLDRLVPERDALYTHTTEGPDDMPAHIKAALTATSLAVPVESGRLLLGTWQGVFLWEHRHDPSPRTILVHIAPDA